MLDRMSDGEKQSKPQIPRPETRPSEPPVGVADSASGRDGVRQVFSRRREHAERAVHRFSEGRAGTPSLPDLHETRTEPIREFTNRIMRKTSGQATNEAAKIPAGGGVPLASDLRRKLEPQLQADLASVRVHTGGESATAAAHYGARAFTDGNDVHFGRGEFNPGTTEGHRLIGHELAHVVQGQNTGTLHRKADDTSGGDGEADGDREVSDPSEPAEKEADAVGDHVAEALDGDKPEDGGDKSAQVDGEKKPHRAAKAPPPKIMAKLAGVGRKIHLARPPRDPATPRDDKRPVPGSVQTQGDVEILVGPGALDHILKGHTVENFDPVARLTEIGAGNQTSLFPPGFATNPQELVTVIKQVLAGKGGRNFDPAAQRSIEVVLRGVKLQVWIGPAGKAHPGAFMVNSVFPVKGVSLTPAEVQKYAADIKSKKKTLQQVRTELLSRFK